MEDILSWPGHGHHTSMRSQVHAFESCRWKECLVLGCRWACKLNGGGSNILLGVAIIHSRDGFRVEADFVHRPVVWQSVQMILNKIARVKE